MRKSIKLTPAEIRALYEICTNLLQTLRLQHAANGVNKPIKDVYSHSELCRLSVYIASKHERLRFAKKEAKLIFSMQLSWLVAIELASKDVRLDTYYALVLGNVYTQMQVTKN